ncbi:MAG TPA: hypothetical protein VM715_02280, partial [Candidatus Acidoferrum sp.]|nr:hypothetical protein [Candidatus Acidoferrum sp.]
VTIAIPKGWTVSSLPKPQSFDVKACKYSLNADAKNDTVHLSRELMINISLVPVRYYPSLRQFFQNVRSADEQQIVLSPRAAN